jgi:hypothetical protein
LNNFTVAEFENPVIHFGGRTKFVLEHPFVDFINRLDYALRSASIIILIGYGMRDRHIGHLINQSFYYGRKTIIQVSPAPLTGGDNQGFVPILISRMGARVSEWEATQMQIQLHRAMRFVSVEGNAEDRKTWESLAHWIKTECPTT